MNDFPIFGQPTLTQRANLRNLMSVAFAAFQMKNAPAPGTSDAYLTGQHVTLGLHNEIVTLAQIEWVEGEVDGFAICEQGWIDVSDGTYAGESLDEILHPVEYDDRAEADRVESDRM